MDQQIPTRRGRSYTRPVDTLGVEATLRTTADKAWQVLPAVLTDLGLEINYRAPAERRIGACFQKLHGRLGKELVSSYVDCGDDRSMPNADRFEVDLTVLASVVSDQDGTAKLYVFVMGVGFDNRGVSHDRIWCFSKASIEERIREGIEARATGN